MEVACRSMAAVASTPKVAPQLHANVALKGSSTRGALRLRTFLAGESSLPRCPKLTKRAATVRPGQAVAWQQPMPRVEFDEEDRFRLNNLRPQPGSRRADKRKGRGIAAGQGASCGFGMRGQKSRSGSGVRPGFEGGQMPLYRRLPKLRGIAGGMPSGQPRHVALNLADILAFAEEGAEVSLQSLKEAGAVKPSGRERNLPLKVLGGCDVNLKFSIKAAAFSASAKEALEKAGCTIFYEAPKKKVLPKAVEARAARTAEYFAKKV